MKYLQVFSRPIPQLFFSPLDHIDSSPFILVHKTIPIEIFHKEKWSLPTRSWGFLLPWFLHLHKHNPFLEIQKHLLPFTSSISSILTCLNLTNIVNIIAMHLGNKLKLVDHLFSHDYKIFICVKSLNQRAKKIINLQSWCPIN